MLAKRVQGVWDGVDVTDQGGKLMEDRDEDNGEVCLCQRLGFGANSFERSGTKNIPSKSASGYVPRFGVSYGDL